MVVTLQQRVDGQIKNVNYVNLGTVIIMLVDMICRLLGV